MSEILFAQNEEWPSNEEVTELAIELDYQVAATQEALAAAPSPSEASRLHRRLERLMDKRVHAAEYNTVLWFADEVRQGELQRFIPAPGQLDERFSLPANTSPTTSPRKAAALLNALPFVSHQQIVFPPSLAQPQIVIQGIVAFPTERILGVESFASWAGRDARSHPRGKSPKSFTPRNLLNIEQTSRGAITEFAQDSAEWFTPPGAAHLQMVKDTSGELWAVATGDGSHRLGAAKLRGAMYTHVASIEISALAEMPQVPFVVRDFFAHEPSPLYVKLARQAVRNIR